MKLLKDMKEIYLKNFLLFMFFMVKKRNL